MKKNFYFIAIIVIIFVLGAWLLWSRQFSVDGWLTSGDNGVKTYHNGRYDFSLMFPRSWSEVRIREARNEDENLSALWVAELPYQDGYQPIFFIEMRNTEQWQKYLQPYIEAGQYLDPADPKFSVAAKNEHYIFSFSRVVELPESITPALEALPGIFKTLRLQ